MGDAVLFAEQRQALADQIAIDLIQRPDLRHAPEAVQDFVLQVWPLVLAHVRLTSTLPGDDPGGYLDVMVKLLWSVRQDATLRRPARLLELIPSLLQRLRQGLALLGRQPHEFEAFFQTLEVLHRPALRLCATRRHRSGLPACDAGPEAPVQTDEATVLAGLQPGACVYLYSRHQWRRATLEWVDANGQQFMFTGQDGQPHAMTRRILKRLVSERLLRLAAPAYLDLSI